MNHKTNVRDFLIPLYLGITGHRDIDCKTDGERLQMMMEEFIRSKRKQYPNTPVILLTPLAEGADRLAAEAAKKCDIDFIVVLPMPRELYSKSFSFEGSNDEFEKLISQALEVIELPVSENMSDIPDYNNPEFRLEQYLQAGIFIAKYSQTLIALWDGKDSCKKGGTAEVINLKRSGIHGNLYKSGERLRHHQTGPVYHIVTPHKSNKEPADPFNIKVYYSKHFGDDVLAAKRDERNMLSQIDTFNKDVIVSNKSLKERAKLSSERLLNYEDSLRQNRTLAKISNRRGISRELTIMFHAKRILSLRILFSLVVMAFIFLQIYAEFVHSSLFLIMYLFMMGTGALWFYFAKIRGFEKKHEDYRSLSEAFRVQFYLRIAAINENVSDYYLKRHRGELEWVLYAMRSSELDAFRENNISLSILENDPFGKYTFLKENWISEQLKYFETNAKKNNVLRQKWESLANWCFLGAILSVCLLILFRIIPVTDCGNTGHINETLNASMVSMTHILIVLAAAFLGYSDKMVFSEQARSYQQMAFLFQIAENKLSQAIENKDEDEAVEIIRELAHEALAENGDWLLLHRARPMEMPKG
jgi:hypothetical protein